MFQPLPRTLLDKRAVFSSGLERDIILGRTFLLISWAVMLLLENYA